MDSMVLGIILAAQRDLYLKPNDKVLVVISTSFSDAPIEDTLLSYDYRIVRIDDPTRPGQEYPLGKDVLDWGADVGWIISSVSLSHSVGAEMIEHGMFVISNPGITEDWAAVMSPENSRSCQQTADALERAIGGDVGGTIHITSSGGTNLYLKVPKGNWTKEVGKRALGEVGTNGVFGEFSTAPYDANGVWMLQPGDFLTNPINRVGSEVKIVIRDNKVERLEGENRPNELYEMLLKANHPLAFNLGEVAIGINPARPEDVKTSVVAEKLLGGAHIAIGTNAMCLRADCPDLDRFAHGRYNAGVHIDCIQFGVSVTFTPEGSDKEILLMEDGKLAI